MLSISCLNKQWQTPFFLLNEFESSLPWPYKDWLTITWSDQAYTNCRELLGILNHRSRGRYQPDFYWWLDLCLRTRACWLWYILQPRMQWWSYGLRFRVHHQKWWNRHWRRLPLHWQRWQMWCNQGLYFLPYPLYH